MRSFLGWLVLLAALGAAAWVLGPMVARPLIADAVRAVSPFGTEPLEVDVEVSAPGLLRGTIDSIHVTGTNLSSQRLRVGRLDMTARDVGVIDHSFASMTGSLDAVMLLRGDGTLLQARQVHVEGPSDELEATTDVPPDASLQLVREAFEGAGLPAGNLALVDGGVRVTILGQRTVVALGAANGAVTAAGSIAGGGSIVIFGPEPGDPWRVTGVSVSPNGMQVQARIELTGLLR
jgi:hypothetical protein